MSTAAATLDRWYALAVITGRERTIRGKILDRLERANLGSSDLEIVCPDEEIILDRGTPERRTRRQLTLPGYMLVRCRQLTTARIVSIRGVTGVMGFLGGDERPQPLSRDDVERMLGSGQKAGAARKAPALTWAIGQMVTITEGPLADFAGEITAVNAGKGTATVAVEIFGRATPAEVPFRQLRRN